MKEENNHNTYMPTDEQLSAYLSNMASKEDALCVEQYLKDNPEAIDDLFNMSMAASIQRQKNRKITKLHPRLLYLSLAAVFVLVLASIFFLNMFQRDNTTLQYANQPIKNIHPQTPQQNPTTPSYSSDEPKRKKNTPKQSSNVLPIQRDEHNTSSIAEVDPKTTFTLSWPRRAKEICSLNQSVSFTWNTNAEKIILTIMDNRNNKIFSQELLNKNTFTLPTFITTKYSEIYWIMTAVFSDSTSVSRSGTIVFINE